MRCDVDGERLKEPYRTFSALRSRRAIRKNRKTVLNLIRTCTRDSFRWFSRVNTQPTHSTSNFSPFGSDPFFTLRPHVVLFFNRRIPLSPRPACKCLLGSHGHHHPHSQTGQPSPTVSSLLTAFSPLVLPLPYCRRKHLSHIQPHSYTLSSPPHAWPSELFALGQSSGSPDAPQLNTVLSPSLIFMPILNILTDGDRIWISHLYHYDPASIPLSITHILDPFVVFDCICSSLNINACSVQAFLNNLI